MLMYKVMDTTHFSHKHHNMNFNTPKKNHRNRRRSNFKKSPVKRFVEEEPWIKASCKNAEEFNNDIQNFPTLNGSSGSVVQGTNIKYGVKSLFQKRRLKKKSKKQEVLPGWVRIYFDKNDKYKIKMEHGPEVQPTHDYQNDLRNIRIQKMIERHEMYQEWDDFYSYIPYWKIEPQPIDDEYYSESESEEYYEEDDYSDDSDSYDYLV